MISRFVASLEILADETPDLLGLAATVLPTGSRVLTAPQLRKEYNRGGGGILALLRDTRAAEPASAARPVGSTQWTWGGGIFSPLAAAASTHPNPNPNGQASICTTELRAELRAGQEKGVRSRGVFVSYAAK